MKVWLACAMVLLAGCFGSADEASEPEFEPNPAGPESNSTQNGTPPPVPALPPFPQPLTQPWSVTHRSVAEMSGTPTGLALNGRSCAVDTPETIEFPAVDGTPLRATLRVQGGDGWAEVGPMFATRSSFPSSTFENGDSTDDAVFGAISGEGQACTTIDADAELIRTTIFENAIPMDVDGSLVTVLNPIEHQRGVSPYFQDEGTWVWITYSPDPLNSIDVYAEGGQTITVLGGPASGIGVAVDADWQNDIWMANPVVTPLVAPGGVVDMDADSHMAFTVSQPLELLRLGDTDDDGGSGAEIILKGITVERAELESSIGEGSYVENSTIGFLSDDHALKIVDSIVGGIDQIGSIDMERLVAYGEISYSGGIDGSLQPIGNLTIQKSNEDGGFTGGAMRFVEGPDIGYDLQITTRGQETSFDMDVEIIEEDNNFVRAVTPGFGNKTIQVTMIAVHPGDFIGIAPFYDGEFL